MAQHSNQRDRGWRTNQRHSYPSQQDAYQDDFTSSAPTRRHGRHDPVPPYERDNDHRLPETNTWEPVNVPVHNKFPTDTGRPPRNDLAGSQPAPSHFPFADRGPPSNWRQQEPNQMHFNDRGFMRDDSRPIHTHGKNTRGPVGDMPQQWRGPQQETATDWRERELPSDFDRGRAGRPMDWEPFQNQAWKEPHGNQSGPPFVQHHPPHQESWTHQNEWQDGPPHWSHQQGRQPYDRPAFQQQNRRQHPYHRPHQSDNQNFNRSGHWDRSGPNHRVSNHSTNTDSKDQRTGDGPTKQGYNRKPEKRRYSRSRSADSNRERRRSQSPKRRRRESPPSASRGVYNRRSRSRESRHSTEKHNERASGKYRKDDDFNHRGSLNTRDKQSGNRKDKYDEDERGRHHKHDRTKPKKHEDDKRRLSRTPSRSRSRSRTPHSRSRSASRSSSNSRVRRRRESGPTRPRSASRSRSRSPSPQTSMANKLKASKHRLPAKSIPRIPLLKDVPLAPSRAVLVTSARADSMPVVPPSSNPTQKIDPTKPGWLGRFPPEPPKGPRDNKYTLFLKDPANQRAEGASALNQFFPDAAPRPAHDPDAIPTLAPVEVAQDPASVSDRIGDNKMKKPKAKMVPIGGTPTDSPASTQATDGPKSQVNRDDMPPSVLAVTTKEPNSPASMMVDPPIPTKDLQTGSAPVSPKAESPTKDASMTPRALIAVATTAPVQAPPPRPRKQEELYKILTQVGEGTFGKVYKARNQVSGMHVALKRIRMEGEKDGFPVTAMREIKLLQSLKHDNVVKLHEMMVSKGLVYMVFDYVHHDLVGILQQTQFQLLPEHLKALSQQMLRGLAYLHLKGIIHRDLKASNILVNSEGQLKLADFGLARFYHKRHQADYTNRVITLWYRPPELLFGATVYGPEVDVWSVGCIFLELFVKKPTFQGNDEIHQLDVIFRILGTPTEERWPALSSLPWYEIVKPTSTIENVFRQSFKRWLSPDALDIAEKMLIFDPKQRITAADALLESYFVDSEPSPLSPDLSTLEGEWHELEAKRVKKKRKAEAETENAEMRP